MTAPAWRLEDLFGAGRGYAELVPGMQKVTQAAGRVNNLLRQHS